MEREHQVFVSDVSIFELAAKDGKHVALGRLVAERVARGIRAIIYNDTIEVVPIHETTILLPKTYRSTLNVSTILSVSPASDYHKE